MNSDNGRIDFQIGLELSQLRSRAGQARDIFHDIGNTTISEGNRIDDSFRNIGNSLRSNIGGAIGNIKGAMLDLGKTMIGMNAIMSGGNFLRELFSESKEFNKQMKIVSTISSEVAGDMENYKQKVMDLCKEMAVAPKTAADALYQISSAGWLGADGMKVLESSARLAVGGVTEVNTAADALTTILNAYHFTADEAEAVSDKLFTTVRLGKTTMDELGQSISAVAPTAATFGVSIDEVLAMIAELTKQGVPTSTAIRQINMAILATTESLGDGAFKTRTLLQAFEEVERKSNGSENALKKDMGNVNALRAVLAATGKNAEESAQMLEEMKNSAGATASAFEKMGNGAAAEITKLRTNFLDALRGLSDGATNVLGDLAKWLNEAFASGNIQKCITALTYLVATYGVYKTTIIVVTALQKLYNGVLAEAAYQKALAAMQQKTLTNAQALGAVVTSRLTRAWKSLTAAMSRNAIGLIITAVIALGYALYKCLTNTTAMEERTKSIAAAMTEASQSAKNEKDEIRKLLTTISTADKTTKEYKDSKDKIISQYGQYLGKLLDEKGQILDLAEAYRVLTREAEESARKRALLNLTESERENKTERDSETMEKLRKSIVGLGYTENEAFSMASRIQQSLVDGNDIPADLLNRLVNYTVDDVIPAVYQGTFNVDLQSHLPKNKKYFTYNDVQAAFDSSDVDTQTLNSHILYEKGRIREYVSLLMQSQLDYNEAVRKAEATLGIDKFDYDMLQGIPEEALQSFVDNIENYAKGGELSMTYPSVPYRNIFSGIKNKEEAFALADKIRNELETRTVAKSFDGLTDGGGTGSINEQEIKNKKYWETQRDEAQKIIDELDDSELNSEKAKEAYAKLKEAKQKLANRTGSAGSSSSKSNKEADERADRDEKIKDYAEETIKSARDAQFEIREAEISAMDEGVEKELAAIDLDYDKLLAANLDRQREMITALADKKTLEWLNAHPKATKQQENDYRNSLLDPYMFYDKNMAGIALTNMANGNVDVLAQPLIKAAKLAEQGWDEAGDGIASVFRKIFDITGADGSAHRIMVTPILPDGTILSPEELNAYISDTLNGTNDILSADEKNIVIGVDLPEGSADKLQQLLDIYYFNSHTPADNALTLDDLTNSERNTLVGYDNAASKARGKANKDLLNNMLEEIHDYEERRTKIAEEYAKRRKQLYVDGDEMKGLRQGVTEGNLAELNRQEKEAIEAVDEEVAQRSETYQAWCNEIGSWSLNALETQLEKAKSLLAEMENDPKIGKDALIIQRAKVNTLIKKVKEARAVDALSPGKRSVEEWEKLYSALEQCQKEFASIGDTIEGVVGDIISSAAQITASSMSMINGIMTLTKWSVKATEMEAEGASKAIQSVEKASVILSIISAAMQIATKIVNLFNSDNSKNKEIERLQQMVDKLQWERDHAEIMRYTSLEDTLNLINTKIAETRGQLYKTKLEAGDTMGAIAAAYGSVRKNSELLGSAAESLADAYARMKYTADKALGEDKYTEARNQLNELAKQQILLSKQADLERSKKDSDSSALEGYKQKIVELGQEMLEIMNTLVEDIMGESAADMAQQLGDAFIEAFQSGEDAAQKWGDKVNDIVADILKRMLVQEFLENPLGALFDRYREKWFPNGMFTSLEEVRNSMPDFASELNGMLAAFEHNWAEIPKDVKDLFVTEAQRQGASQGIATASQDSVDELNARMTTVQGHTYALSENSKILVSTTSRILESVVNIDRNTDGLSNRVATVESVVKDMRNTLNDISTKGLKIK